MDDFKLNIENTTLKIDLIGEINAVVANDLQGKLEEMKDKNLTKVIFDLEKVTFIASSGLRLFIFAKKRIADNMNVDLVNAKDFTIKLIKMSGITNFVNLVE